MGETPYQAQRGAQRTIARRLSTVRSFIHLLNMGFGEMGGLSEHA